MFTNRADHGPVSASTPIGDAERQRFVDDLLDYMTLEEKAGQLVAVPQAPDPTRRNGHRDDAEFYDRLRAGLICAVGGTLDRAQADALQQIAIEETRLGIPLLFMAETGRGIATIMPAPAAAAASWDPAAIEAAERIVAGEARTQGINWSLSPEIRLAAGCAASGYAQTSGSDPYLASRIAVARIRGIQHEVGEDGGVIATLGLSEDTPSGSQPGADARPLVLEAVREGRVGSIAIAAGGGETVAGADRTGKVLELLRRPGGFSGLLTGAWAELAAAAGQGQLEHGFMNLSPDRLVAAVRAGTVSEGRVDEAVRSVLALKFDLGLFRSPFRGPVPSAPDRPARARNAALELARRSIVLLRNDMALLPVGADSRDILVVGTAATDRGLPLGGRQDEAASVIDGLEQLGLRHRYVPGLALRQNGAAPHRLIDADRMAIGMACEAARRAGVVIVALGNEGRDAAQDSIGEASCQLLSALRAVNERIVLLALGDRPVNPAIDGAPLPCVIHAGQLGTMSGHAIADVLTGRFGPVGHLPAPLVAREASRSLPFGFGLGYGAFTWSNFALETGDDSIVASLDLRNAGELAGSETIQLYIRRCDGPRGGDALMLRGFARATLKPEERTSVRFHIGASQLGRYAADGRFVVEEGVYEIQLGPDSVRVQSGEVAVSAELARAMRGIMTGRDQGLAHGIAGLRRA